MEHMFQLLNRLQTQRELPRVFTRYSTRSAANAEAECSWLTEFS
jgi:hypothetical protein